MKVANMPTRNLKRFSMSVALAPPQKRFEADRE